MDEKDMSDLQKIENALKKKASGYRVEEVVEEYTVDEQNLPSLIKKKRMLKHYPPDVSAIKILLSYYGNQNLEELESLSDEQLLQRRDELLKALQKFELKKEKN